MEHSDSEDESLLTQEQMEKLAQLQVKKKFNLGYFWILKGRGNIYYMF